MMRCKPALFAAALFCAGCEGLIIQTAEYRPQEAGTVDQAMCLLGFTGIPLRKAPTGHDLIDVELNGVIGVFVLDTGANVSVIDARHVEAFGLAPSASALPARGYGLGGGQNIRMARVESMRVGELAIRIGRIAVADVSHVAAVLGPLAGGTVYGIIGQDVMREHRAVVDVARPILYLMEAGRDPAPVPLETCTAEQEAE